jgi:hypothetical protein
MVLEGAMIVIAAVLMTLAHPGGVFGEKWVDAGWRWGKNGTGDIEGSGAGVQEEAVEGKGSV